MEQFLLASHGSLARAMKETAAFLLGTNENVHCLCAYVDEASMNLEQMVGEWAAGRGAVRGWVGGGWGEPVEFWEERSHARAPVQVNAGLMAKAKGTAVFMHCLPAYHDHKTAVGREMGEKFDRDVMEVTDEVFNGPQSIVFQEAENRMHTIKAVMAATLGA